MNRAGRWLALLAMAWMASGCDPSGRALEDARLSRLTEGRSTEQDIVRVFGQPAAVQQLAGGQGLVYPLGPEGAHTLLIKVGADGRYQGRENLLTRQNFARVETGMTQADVLALLGPPGRTQPLPLKRQVALEWRFADGDDTRIFVAMINEAGRVVGTAIEDDPRRHGG